MRTHLLALTFPFLLLLTSGCTNLLSMGEVATAGVAATSAYAAWEITPDSWTNSEKAATAAATGAGVYIAGKMLMAKADQDKVKAFQQGFASGKAYGARRQFEIVQALQKDEMQYSRNVYAIPAPVAPGIKTEPYNVYLEVTE